MSQFPQTTTEFWIQHKINVREDDFESKLLIRRSGAGMRQGISVRVKPLLKMK